MSMRQPNRIEILGDLYGTNQDGALAGELQIQSERFNVYFNEGIGGRCVSRAVLFDLESGTIDSTRVSHLGSLFRPDNYVSGSLGAGTTGQRATTPTDQN
jgi:tubulin beta